ncbi:MAG: hypothetical protein HGA39_08705 [Coriobacteriia bacterium]|nr:hypothetical protein [Coriobacteriia bacterium]
MPEAVLVWAAEKILLPIANSTFGRLTRAAPGWLKRLRSYVRVQRLEREVSAEELAIISFISGRQYDYLHIEREFAGRLEGEGLLLAVTKLQVLGLLSAARLQQPPHPEAMFTVAGEAKALLQAKTVKLQRIRPRRRDIPDAVDRRKRAAENAEWLMNHARMTRVADYVKQESVEEAKRRRQELSDDQCWLTERGL